MVKEGDLLALIDPRPFQAALDQATATKAQHEAQRANAQRDLIRTNKLGAYATGQQRDTQMAQVDQLTAQIAGDEAAIENARDTALLYADHGAAYRAHRLSARRSGQYRARLRSERPCHDRAAAADCRNFHAARALSRRRAAGDEGRPGEVWALQQDAKTEIAQGTLALIDNSVDPTTGTIRLKAMFPNEDNKLWPGEFVNVRIQTGVLKDAITIPATAVLQGQDGPYAYVVNPDNKVEPRPLKTGYSTEQFYVVKEEVKVGETVVTGGQYRLTAGTLVAINKDNGSSQPPEHQAAK